MTANITVTTEYGELDDLANPATMRAVERRANELNARETYRHSQRLVPVDTGALKRSGEVKPDGPTDYLMTYEGGAGGREYAMYVEFGTRRMPSQPYIRPAIEKTDVEGNGKQALREVTGVS